MTPRQKVLMDFINNYRLEHGISPTIREMSSALGSLNPSLAYAMVERLIRDGRLVRTGVNSSSPRTLIPAD